MMYAEGYIERRQVDGVEMFFAQIDRPGFWYGPLRDSKERAKQDGREECAKRGLYVPCFGMEKPSA